VLDDLAFAARARRKVHGRTQAALSHANLAVDQSPSPYFFQRVIFA